IKTPLTDTSATIHSTQQISDGGDSIKPYLQNLMWKYAGIIRDKPGLDYCLKELNKLKQQIEEQLNKQGISKSRIELLNLIETSQLIVGAALKRKESRGCHFRKDVTHQDAIATHSMTKQERVKELLT